MALDKASLKTDLKAGFITIFSNPQINNNVETVSDQLATLISDKVDVYVKTGRATGTDTRGDGHNLTII